MHVRTVSIDMNGYWLQVRLLCPDKPQMVQTRTRLAGLVPCSSFKESGRRREVVGV